MRCVKLFFLIGFSLISISESNAQLELKESASGLVFKNPDISAEYIIRDEISVEITIGVSYGNATRNGTPTSPRYYTKKGFESRITGKYYPKYKKGADKLYAGLYLEQKNREFEDVKEDLIDTGFARTTLSLGFVIGAKWLADSGLLFEVGAGVAKTVVNTFSAPIIKIPPGALRGISHDIGISAFGKVSIGYRF